MTVHFIISDVNELIYGSLKFLWVIKMVHMIQRELSWLDTLFPLRSITDSFLDIMNSIIILFASQVGGRGKVYMHYQQQACVSFYQWGIVCGWRR